MVDPDGDGGGRKRGQTDPEGLPVTLLGVGEAVVAALTVFGAAKGRATKMAAAQNRRSVSGHPVDGPSPSKMSSPGLPGSGASGDAKGAAGAAVGLLVDELVGGGRGERVRT